MKQSIHISIPTPCHEAWDKMDATERGAFCHSCAKEVIDFSAMTDREVIEYLQKNKAGCGRFRKDQVDTKLTIPQVDNGIFRWRAVALSVLAVCGFKNLMATPINTITSDQGTKAKTEKRDTIEKMQSATVEAPRHMGLADVRNYIEDTIQQPDQDSMINICGTVVDEKGEGIIQAAISLVDLSGKNAGIGTTTDFDGNFSIDLSRQQLTQFSHSLKISYVGFGAKIISVSDAAKQSYNIKLVPKEPMMTGDVVIQCTVGFMVPIKGEAKVPVPQKTNWFKRIFGKHPKEQHIMGRL